MNVTSPFFLLKPIHDRFEARGNIAGQKAGITHSQFRVLLYLNAHSDKIVTQHEMEIAFNVSHPTISGILKRMEENGFVKTQYVQEAKKQKQVFLTEKGKNAIKIMDKSKDHDDSELSKLFTEEELGQLEDYLKRILDYLNKEE